MVNQPRFSFFFQKSWESWTEKSENQKLQFSPIFRTLYTTLTLTKLERNPEVQNNFTLKPIFRQLFKTLDIFKIGAFLVLFLVSQGKIAIFTLSLTGNTFFALFRRYQAFWKAKGISICPRLYGDCICWTEFYKSNR